MIEALLKRLLFRAVMDKAEQKDKEFIEGYDEEQLEENVIYKGYEYQYLENVAAAARMMSISKLNASMYDRCIASYTLYFEDEIYLNNYKKEGIRITYQQLAECKKNGNIKYNKGRGIASVKLDNKEKYLMFVCGSDKDREKEQEITNQIAEFLGKKCGVQII